MAKVAGLAALLGIGLSLESRPAACEESADVRLMSYNVLSPPLAPPSQFPTCNPKDLEKGTRLSRILTRLDAAVQERSVIALQEVDLEWAGQLHVFFSERDYTVVFAQYGHRFNNYMGVMLAWPRQVYEAVDVEICKVSDTAPKTMWPKAQRSVLNDHGFLTFEGLKEVIGCKPPEVLKVDQEWNWAQSRANEAIFARLRRRDDPKQRFCVGTYHMPCFFGSPEKVRVVNIHSQLLLKRLAEFSKGDPLALMGDFNFKPEDSPYSLVESGGAVQKVAPASPAEFRGLEQRLPKGTPLETGLQSAYKAFHGKEPILTNFVVSSFAGGEFAATLDYIWFSPGKFSVVACPPLPDSKLSAKGPYPNATEPSDHLPLRATLRFSQ